MSTNQTSRQSSFEEIKSAAEAGDAASQCYIGICYQTGQGVAQDYVAAHKWFNLAALRGSDIAKNWRNQIAEEMNAGQIAQAQKLAREWLNIFK